MPSKQRVGRRAEILFQQAITKWCENGEPLFDEAFKSPVAEGLDFDLAPIGTTVFAALASVQVKTTVKKDAYTGTGKDRVFHVRLTAKDARKLGRMAVPAYVVGVDVYTNAVYIRAVLHGTTSGFTTMTTRFKLNCKRLKELWQEIQDFWNHRPQNFTTSAFEE
jgi:hypothetical protein